MTTDFSLWWQALTILQKVYWLIAIPFSVFFVLQTVMSLLGGDMLSADGDADLAIESDTGIDFQFLSIKNLVAFFTLFGWVGILTSSSGMAPVWSVLLAIVAGLLMMLLMATLMYFMGKLTESGTLELKKATGKTGTVYLTIPPKRAGMGKVQISIQGFQTLDALTDDENEIHTGAVVEVVDTLNEEILIVKRTS
jgi:membrane protein implicated in regulation of membrane protease activity